MRFGLITLLLAGLLLPTTAFAAPPSFLGVDVSGFFDIQAVTPRIEGDLLFFGNLELGLGRDFGTRTRLDTAIVMNEQGAEVTVAVVDVAVFAERLHLQAGRFDVPFGQDWQHFASKDRVELSAPLTTDLLMDGGLNDRGLRVLGTTGTIHYSAFAMRGEASRRVGGRVGATTERFDGGVSLMRESGVTFLALDARGRIGRAHVRGEYLRREAEPIARSGWHVTASVDAGKITPYVRFDTVTDARRFTTGLHFAVLRSLLFKVEHQRVEATTNAWFAQAVFVF